MTALRKNVNPDTFMDAEYLNWRLHDLGWSTSPENADDLLKADHESSHHDTDVPHTLQVSLNEFLFLSVINEPQSHYLQDPNR